MIYTELSFNLYEFFNYFCCKYKILWLNKKYKVNFIDYDNDKVQYNTIFIYKCVYSFYFIYLNKNVIIFEQKEKEKKNQRFYIYLLLFLF